MRRRDAGLRQDDIWLHRVDECKQSDAGTTRALWRGHRPDRHHLARARIDESLDVVDLARQHRPAAPASRRYDIDGHHSAPGVIRPSRIIAHPTPSRNLQRSSLQAVAARNLGPIKCGPARLYDPMTCPCSYREEDISDLVTGGTKNAVGSPRDTSEIAARMLDQLGRSVRR